MSLCAGSSAALHSEAPSPLGGQRANNPDSLSPGERICSGTRTPYLVCDIFMVILQQVPLQHHHPGHLLLQSNIILFPLICFTRRIDQSFSDFCGDPQEAECIQNKHTAVHFPAFYPAQELQIQCVWMSCSVLLGCKPFGYSRSPQLLPLGMLLWPQSTGSWPRMFQILVGTIERRRCVSLPWHFLASRPGLVGDCVGQTLLIIVSTGTTSPTQPRLILSEGSSAASKRELHLVA